MVPNHEKHINRLYLQFPQRSFYIMYHVIIKCHGSEPPTIYIYIFVQSCYIMLYHVISCYIMLYIYIHIYIYIYIYIIYIYIHSTSLLYPDCGPLRHAHESRSIQVLQVLLHGLHLSLQSLHCCCPATWLGMPWPCLKSEESWGILMQEDTVGESISAYWWLSDFNHLNLQKVGICTTVFISIVSGELHPQVYAQISRSMGKSSNVKPRLKFHSGWLFMGSTQIVTSCATQMIPHPGIYSSRVNIADLVHHLPKYMFNVL